MSSQDARSRVMAYQALALGRLAQSIAMAGMVALVLTVLLVGVAHAAAPTALGSSVGGAHSLLLTGPTAR